MSYTRFEQTDLKVSKICFGIWQFGGLAKAWLACKEVLPCYHRALNQRGSAVVPYSGLTKGGLRRRIALC
jgi:hypothetical protein